MVMISGYESALYKESLKSWHAHCFQAACHHGVATEWLWRDYEVPVDLHEYRYLGNNFRERERIKRKTKRWAAKLQSIPVSACQALLSALDEALGSSVYSSYNGFRILSEIKLSEYTFTRIWFPVKPKTRSALVYHRSNVMCKCGSLVVK
ncbi:MAG: hypothetical protein MRK01_09770 [Candidatus Scalindua sp.]|nr:hypothetical protein [Candidatus Scalindua sp.]